MIAVEALASVGSLLTMRRSWALAAMTVVLVLAPAMPAAASDSFLDRGARVFTLLRPSSVELEPVPEIWPQGAFPDGSVLGSVGRLWPSGAVTANVFDGEIVDPKGLLLRVSEGRVERVDPRSGTSTVVAEIGDRTAGLTLLDDGRLVVFREGRWWWIETDGTVREFPELEVSNTALAPLPGGRLIAWGGKEFVLVETDGTRRSIARRSCCPTLTPLRDGRILVTDRDGVSRLLELIAWDGTITRIAQRDRRVYGNGDGALALTEDGWLKQASIDGSAVHAADGSLIFTSDDAEQRTSVRAVIPASSRRAYGR